MLYHFFLDRSGLKHVRAAIINLVNALVYSKYPSTCTFKGFIIVIKSDNGSVT